MPEKLATITASLGSYEDKDGKKHAVHRNVGFLYQHSDGRCFIMMNAVFDYGRIPVAPGKDSFFLEVVVPKDLKLDLVERPSI